MTPLTQQLEDKNITMKEFIKIIERIAKVSKNLKAIQMTEEFYKQLLSTMNSYDIEKPKTILGFRIIITKELASMVSGKKINWDIIDPTIRYQ